MASNNRTAEYKGRKYRLLFLGDTKYGRRARLQFFDGSKDFWVDASLVREVTESSSTSRRTLGNRRFAGSSAYSPECYACREARRCGKEACRQCLFDEYDD